MADAVSALKETMDQLFSAGNAIAEASNGMTSTSLTQNAKKCFIESRAYVDKDIEHEKVTSGILKFALTMQASLILSAFKLDSLVANGVTVSDKLRMVATESSKPYLDTAALLKKDSISLEGVNSTIQGKAKQVLNHLESDQQKQIARLEMLISGLQNNISKLNTDLYNTTDKSRSKLIQNKIKALQSEIQIHQAKLDELQAEYARTNAVGDSDVTPSTDVNLAVGKVLNITLQGPAGKADLPLYVRINPYMVGPELISYMIETAGPTILNGVRTAQLKAGEISFWRDFVFGVDLVERQQSILGKDKSGEFANYIRSLNAKDRGRTVDLVRKGLSKDPKAYRTSSNLANAILVFSEDAVKDGEMRGGLKLKDYHDRQKFFGKSYAAMIFVIDPNHERVTMYLNGFKDVGHYSYSDFIHKKDLEGEDFMSVLRSVAQGQISRF